MNELKQALAGLEKVALINKRACDKGGVEASDFEAVLINISKHYPTVPSMKIYDLFIDFIIKCQELLKNDEKAIYMQKYCKVYVESRCKNYISKKKNRVQIESLDVLLCSM